MYPPITWNNIINNSSYTSFIIQKLRMLQPKWVTLFCLNGKSINVKQINFATQMKYFVIKFNCLIKLNTGFIITPIRKLI
jgi:hypothetical protein